MRNLYDTYKAACEKQLIVFFKLGVDCEGTQAAMVLTQAGISLQPQNVVNSLVRVIARFLDTRFNPAWRR